MAKKRRGGDRPSPRGQFLIRMAKWSAKQKTRSGYKAKSLI